MSDQKKDDNAPHATLDLNDHVAMITLNRPSKRNSISQRMLDEIDGALDRIVAEDRRVLIIKGAGGNFCAGADLNFVSGLLADNPSAFSEEFIPRVQQVMNRIEDLPIPVIASIEGYCMAGGFELLLCCDIVIAAKSAKLADGHSIYGFLPGSGGAYRLARKAGVNRAKYIAFTGDIFTADEMLEMGLISRVCTDDDLESEVTELSKKLAARSPIGLQRMKELIHIAEQSDRATGLMSERIASAAHTRTFDMQEGLAAFSEKRTPSFKGQ